MLHFFLPKQRFSHIYFYKNSKGKEMITENDADEFLKTQPGTGLQDSIHKEQPALPSAVGPLGMGGKGSDTPLMTISSGNMRKFII